MGWKKKQLSKRKRKNSYATDKKYWDKFSPRCDNCNLKLDLKFHEREGKKLCDNCKDIYHTHRQTKVTSKDIEYREAYIKHVFGGN